MLSVDSRINNMGSTIELSDTGIARMTRLIGPRAHKNNPNPPFRISGLYYTQSENDSMKTTDDDIVIDSMRYRRPLNKKEKRKKERKEKKNEQKEEKERIIILLYIQSAWDDSQQRE